MDWSLNKRILIITIQLSTILVLLSVLSSCGRVFSTDQYDRPGGPPTPLEEAQQIAVITCSNTLREDMGYQGPNVESDYYASDYDAFLEPGAYWNAIGAPMPEAYASPAPDRLGYTTVQIGRNPADGPTEEPYYTLFFYNLDENKIVEYKVFYQ